MKDDDSISITSTNLSETDFQLNDFDVSAYNIPPSGAVQSLESILNESDTRSLLSDWDASVTVPPTVDTARYTSNGSDVSSWSTASTCAGRGQPLRKPIRYDGHGPLLKLKKHESISQTLEQQVDNEANVGTATCMAVSSIVAIGTLHGYVLLFNGDGGLLRKLGTRATASDYGAASAISLNRDATRVLVGHAHGQITMWDCGSGKLLRTIVDAHPPQTAVLHIKFTDDFTVAVFSDSGGSVYELSFKRLLGVRSYDSRCLFSGSRAEVCVVEPLLTSDIRSSKHGHHIYKGHTEDIVVLAMCSLSKIILMTIKPEMKVYFIHNLKGDPDTLPLIAWQYAIIESKGSKRVVQPIISFARQNKLHFYQVSIINAHSISCTHLQKIQLTNFSIIGMKWLNSRTLIVMDTNEVVRIVDVRSQQQLDTYDCSSLRQVYSTVFYRALATGGNVSEAMAFSGRMACFNTIDVHGGQMFLLCDRSVHSLSIRSWTERVDKMISQGRYEDAIGWLQQCSRATAKAVNGITPSFADDIVAKWKVTILSYLDELTSNLVPRGACIDDILFHYKANIPAIVDCCIEWNQLDVLFDEVFDRCSTIADCLESYLFSLERHILSNRITKLTPAVTKCFVLQYEHMVLYDDLQTCLMKLDVSCYDIDQIVKLCWRVHLYDLLIHVYNVAMLDYLSPFREMALRLSEHVARDFTSDEVKPLSDSQIELGNKAFVYLSCCLAGQAYFSGNDLTSYKGDIRDDTFALLTTLYANPSSKDDEIYLILKTMIRFNERDFFNILTLNLEHEYYSQEKWIEKLQRLVDILLQIMVHSSTFNEKQRGVLFTFLARQLSRESNKLFVNRDLFQQVLESLCSASSSSSLQHHEELQQTLKELLIASENLSFQSFDCDHLLCIARQAKFYDVCERLYGKRHEYHLIVECYVEDPSRHQRLFRFVDSLMRDDSLPELQRQKVVEAVFNKVEDVVSIDCWQTAILLLSHMSDRLTKDLYSQFTDRQLLFSLLHDIDKQIKENRSSSLSANAQVALCIAYVDLMCRYRPLAVVRYLTAIDDDLIEPTLEVCMRNNVLSGVAYLLERLNRCEKAYQVLYEGLNQSIESFKASSSENTRRQIFGEIDAICGATISFCQRSTIRLSADKCEAMWFPILDAMLDNQKLFSENMSSEFQNLTTLLMNGMMGHVSLQTMVKRILKNPTQVHAIGNIRQFMLDLISNYDYEKTLLDTVVRVLKREMVDDFRRLGGMSCRGHLVKPAMALPCDLCASRDPNSDDSSKPRNTSSQLLHFGCGHTFHLSCMARDPRSAPADIPQCPRCRSHERPVAKATDSHRFMSPLRCGELFANLEEDADELFTSTNLSNNQLKAIRNLRESQKTESRLEILGRLSKNSSVKGKSILDKKIKLKLMPS